MCLPRPGTSPESLRARPGPELTGDAGAPPEDATALLSPNLQNELASGAIAFLSPVEAGSRARGLGDQTQWVTVPHDWTSTSTVTPITFENGVFTEPRLGRLGGPCAPPLTPDPRNGGAQSLLADEPDVYLLVGGQRDGQNTKDVWRDDLGAHEWFCEAFRCPR